MVDQHPYADGLSAVSGAGVGLAVAGSGSEAADGSGGGASGAVAGGAGVAAGAAFPDAGFGALLSAFCPFRSAAVCLKTGNSMGGQRTPL